MNVQNEPYDSSAYYYPEEFVGYEEVPMPLSWRIENWLYDIYCNFINFFRYKEIYYPRGIEKFRHGGTVPISENVSNNDLSYLSDAIHATNVKLYKQRQEDMWRKPSDRLPTSLLLPQRPMNKTITTMAGDYKYVVGIGWVNRNKTHIKNGI